MKRLVLFTLLIGHFLISNAQVDPVVHKGTFNNRKSQMSSNPYKPDEWEKSYYDSSLKAVFPSDLIKNPDKYLDKLIHLIGIVDSIYIDNNNNITFRLENKFWDYIEDYGMQDERMFVSEKGDGKFYVTLSNSSSTQYADFKNFPEENKLFLVYGQFKGLSNNIPVLTAVKIKYYDYELYTTKVFSYEIKRDRKGNVATDKEGYVQRTNFKYLKIAQPGQNK